MFGFIDDFLSSPGGGFLGDVILGERKEDRARHAAQHFATQQMDFQERMSSTAYQRAVKDMGDAGLNPMLAYSQGGAHSPAGSGGGSTDPGSAMHSSAASARHVQEQVKFLQEQTRKERLQGDILEGPAAVGRAAKHGAKEIESIVPQVQEKTTDLIEKVMEEILPGAQGKVTDLLEKGAEGTKALKEKVDRIIKSLPDKVKSMVFSSAEQVKHREHIKGAEIPPAKRGKPMGKMRGKLGSAESWDYGSTRHD